MEPSGGRKKFNEMLQVAGNGRNNGSRDFGAVWDWEHESKMGVERGRIFVRDWKMTYGRELHESSRQPEGETGP